MDTLMIVAVVLVVTLIILVFLILTAKKTFRIRILRTVRTYIQKARESGASDKEIEEHLDNLNYPHDFVLEAEK